MTMENTNGGAGGSNGFQRLIQRFWGFDQMIGSALIKIIYYIGLFGIGLSTLAMMFGGGLMGAMSGMDGGAMFILAPIMGIIWLVFWRFICELWLLMFLMYARMGEIRDRLPPR